jgi:hypothetical protein
VHRKSNLFILIQFRKTEGNIFISRECKVQSEETATCPEAYSISIEVMFRLVTITQLKDKQKVMFTKEEKKESH